MVKLLRHSFLATGLFVFLLAIVGQVFASAPSASTCQGYLSSSNTDFLNQIKNNSSTASSVATILDQCMQYNVCSDIAIDNCGALLANRDYISNYYANLSGGSLQSGNAVMTAAPTTSKTVTAPATQATAPSTTSNKSSSISWF